MNQSLTIAANSNANTLRLIMYELTAPNTPVATSIDYDPPHAVSQPVVFAGLNQVAHYARLFEVVGGVLGSMIAQDKVEPTAESINTPADIELNVGNTVDDELVPGGDSWDGSVDYPLLVGKIAKVDYRILQRGIGPLRDDEYDDDSSGGTAFKWKLLGGATFNDQDTFFVQFLPSIVINPANYQGSNSATIQDIVEVTADASLDSTYLNKIVDINSATSTIVLTLLAVADWPEMRPMEFVTNRGSQINAVIKAQTGEKIYFEGGEVNEVYMRSLQYLRLTKKGSRIYVENFRHSYDQVGNIIYNHKQPKNSIAADGSILLKAEYPALWAFVNSLGLGNGVVTNPDWITDATTHKGKYATVDSTSFRVPDLRGVAIRGLDNGRGLDTMRTAAGTASTISSYQADGNLKHGHAINTTNSGASSGSNTDPVRGNTVGDANDRGQNGANKTISEEGNLEATMKNVGIPAWIVY
jgi:hypothetical protein